MAIVYLPLFSTPGIRMEYKNVVIENIRKCISFLVRLKFIISLFLVSSFANNLPSFHPSKSKAMMCLSVIAPNYVSTLHQPPKWEAVSFLINSKLSCCLSPSQ